MKKKYIIISIIIVIVLTLLIAFLSYLAEKRAQEELLNKSKSFVEHWANYKDETSDEYYSSISPYVTDDILSEYKDAGAEIKEMRGSRDPVTSGFNIEGNPTIKKANSTYTVALKGTRKYSVSPTAIQQTVTIIWAKEKNQYIITEVYTE